MTTSKSFRAIFLASLALSAGFTQSCVVQSDDHDDEGGSDSAGGDSIAGSTSGAGPAAGISGSIGGAGSVAGVAGSFGSAGSVAGVAGSFGGTAGSVGGLAGCSGDGGSVAGIVGAIGGVSGGFSEAGANAGGGGEPAGNGGSNVAGGGSTGAAGSGGLGGAPIAGASGSAATAGTCGGADLGCAGTSGSAGAPATAGSGGNGDPSLPLVLSSKVMNFPATECGTVSTASNTFTITNPSSVTKTWTTATGGTFAFLATPTGSSLSPGEIVTVTVKPPFVPAGSLPNGSSPLMTGALIVIEGTNTQSILVSQPIAGAFYAWTPANLNFGVVPRNTSASLHLTQSGDSSGRAIGNNPAFVATISPQSSHEWTFSFTATTVGTQTATFTWQSVPPRLTACTPNTFTATATVPVQ